MVWIGTQEDTKISMYQILEGDKEVIRPIATFLSFAAAKESRDRYHKGGNSGN